MAWQAVSGGADDPYILRNYLKMETFPHAMYQWSTIGHDNKLTDPRTRDLMITKDMMKPNTDFELYIAIVYNSAAIIRTLTPLTVSNGFQPQVYTVTTQLQDITDRRLCLN